MFVRWKNFWMVNKFIKNHFSWDGETAAAEIIWDIKKTSPKTALEWWSGKKRNNMIWIKMINYEIMHSSFMFWCSWSHELFPAFLISGKETGKKYQQFGRGIFFIHQLRVWQTVLTSFEYRVSLRWKVFSSNINSDFILSLFSALLSMIGREKESLCNYPSCHRQTDGLISTIAFASIS